MLNVAILRQNGCFRDLRGDLEFCRFAIFRGFDWSYNSRVGNTDNWPQKYKNNFNDLIESFEKSKRLGLNLALNIQFNGDLYLFLAGQFFEKNYHLGF